MPILLGEHRSVEQIALTVRGLAMTLRKYYCKRGSKSWLIAEYFIAHPAATNKEVAEALKDNGVDPLLVVKLRGKIRRRDELLRKIAKQEKQAAAAVESNKEVIARAKVPFTDEECLDEVLNIVSTLAQPAESKEEQIDKASADKVANEQEKSIKEQRHEDDISEEWFAFCKDVHISAGSRAISMALTSSDLLQLSARLGKSTDPGEQMELIKNIFAALLR
jgi:hypothetical protein